MKKYFIVTAVCVLCALVCCGCQVVEHATDMSDEKRALSVYEDANELVEQIETSDLPDF